MFLARLSAIVLAVLLAAPASATPRSYVLDSARSVVAFAWMMGPERVEGRMRVASADLAIDFAQLALSRINVAVDVTKAEAGFLFATQALKGPKVLDAARYGQIGFVGRTIKRAARGALVEGDITIRGVTRPMVLQASFHQRADTLDGDLDHLQILLRGSVNRSDFGADGWSDMVGDKVELNILVYIDAK